MIDAEFWSDRRVLITGHTGFKGSWLALWLQTLGADVTGYALPPPTSPSLYTVASVDRGMRSIIADIRDADRLRQELEAARPEIVLHLAAQPLVRKSYLDPVDTYSTNVMGLVHLLEAVRTTDSVRAVIVVTSDKCYENQEWEWGYRESEPMGGYDPYSSSKGCAELITSAYRRSYLADAGVGIASGRAGNVIGGGDWADDRLVPDLVRAFGSGESAVIRNPGAIRPWQHVLEPLSGYLMLAERLFAERERYAGGWNFGPENSSVQRADWIARTLAADWGHDASWRVENGNGPHEARVLKLDSSKAQMRLGWHSCWDLPEALHRVVSWHKAQRKHANMRDETIAQIVDYSAVGARGDDDQPTKSV